MLLTKRAVGAAGAVVVAAALGAGVYARNNAHSAAEDAALGAPEAAAGPTSAASAFGIDVAIPVQGVAAVRDTLVLSVSASGEAAAWQRATVVAEVGGRVTEVPVREAGRVAGGEVVAVLDTLDRALAVAEAEAARREAEARYREQLLFDGRLSAEVRGEREQAARVKSGLDRAEIQLRKAKLDLDRTRVRAPFPGRVASVKVVSGQQVAAGGELMTVVDLDPIRLQVQVLEGELSHLVPGGQAKIRFAAFPDEALTGTIRTINPLVDETTRMARVTVLVPNPASRILPGMYARVELEAERIPDRILVPRSAILERDRRTMLFVHEHGRAKWRYVTTGRENADLVEIVESAGTEGVEPGEIVLTAGHFTLTHDATVRLVDDFGRTAEERPR